MVDCVCMVFFFKAVPITIRVSLMTSKFNELFVNITPKSMTNSENNDSKKNVLS